MRGVFLALGLALGGGCSEAAYQRCAVLCGEGGACPGDLVCGTDQFCHAPGEETVCTATMSGDGTIPPGIDALMLPGPDSETPPDQPDAARLHACDEGWTVGPYTDEFSGTLPAWAAIYQGGGTTAQIVDDAFQVDLSTMGESSGEFYIDAMIDARNRVFRTHVLEAPSTMTAGEAVLNYWVDMDNFAWIGISGGPLSSGVTVNGTPQFYDAPGSLEDARWWQIRVAGGRVYLEVSENGTSWTKLGDRSAPGFLSAVSPGLYGGTLAQVGSPGRVRFDMLLDCMIP